MKMWKKLAACVLAAAMALTLLTACGGGGGGSTGGGSGSNSVVRDKTKEDQAISWVQEYATNYGCLLYTSDTGIALQNGHILVDLFYETYAESVINGAIQVNVYVVN